jgi:hypothetical protein
MVLTLAVLSLGAIPAAAAGDFDQGPPRNGEISAITKSLRALKPMVVPAKHERPEESVDRRPPPHGPGGFDMVSVVQSGCSAPLDYYQSRSRCYQRAVQNVGDSHLGAIARSCTGLRTYQDESQCFSGAISTLPPGAYREYATAAGIIRAMCSGLSTYRDEALCFDAATQRAGGHFLPIRTACQAPMDYYESRVRCYRGALSGY